MVVGGCVDDEDSFNELPEQEAKGQQLRTRSDATELQAVV
jgi:hypothetical protein